MLKRATNNIWYLPHEAETDRPCLFYVRGQKRALAVGDAVCGDYYENEGEMAPEKRRALVELLEGIPFTHCLLGHDAPCHKGEILKELRG